MKVTSLASGSIPIRLDGSNASSRPVLFAAPATVHVTGPVTPPSTSSVPTGAKGDTHHTWWYAVIAIVSAAIVLAGMAAWQYVSTQTTAPTVTVTSAVPAQYAGVSIPQAMRLSDTVVSAIPAQYAGVSIPQAMRLSDTVVSAIPAEYAGVSIPQAMRLSDTVVSAVPAQYAGVSIPQAMRLSDAA